MKHITSFLSLALVAVVILPSPASALSCLDPEGSIGYFVSGEDTNFSIVTATPSENKEFIKKKAVGGDDANSQFDSGYSAQFLQVSESHKGSVPDSMWVYFERNETWNYLCSGGPVSLNTENVYVLSQPNSVFDVLSVAAVYPTESDLGKKLVRAASEVTVAPFEEKPQVYEATKDFWMQELYTQLKEMAFYVEIKLAEWKFWLAK